MPVEVRRQAAAGPRARRDRPVRPRLDGRAGRGLPDRRAVRVPSTRPVAALIGCPGRPALGRSPPAGRSTRCARCSLVAVVVIEAAFVRTDFSVALVADHSSTTTPLLYKLTALWGSQAGSLLLWAFVLSIASAAVLYLTRNRHREVVPWATAVLAGVAIFFIGLMVAGSSSRARELAVRGLDPVAAGGRRADPAAAPSGDGDPPADALLGLRLLHDPVRVRGRSADHPSPRRELDPLDPALRAGRLDLPVASASRSAPAGPTASSAGAATGPGTRSRTRR